MAAPSQLRGYLPAPGPEYVLQLEARVGPQGSLHLALDCTRRGPANDTWLCISADVCARTWAVVAVPAGGGESAVVCPPATDILLAPDVFMPM